MAKYRQYCPIARASELVAERWSLLIIRNLLFGADTFTAIANGVPMMSRSMLIKRLRELERAGVITRVPKDEGSGSLYRLTEAGADLADVVSALGEWGTRWVEVTTEHCDPGFALWAWCQVQLDRDALPEDRMCVRFTFPDERPGNRRYWLLVENRDAEVCYSDPGDEPALDIQARSQPFVDWHRGARSWSSVLGDGSVVVHGPTRLARLLPRWHRDEPVLEPPVVT